jgi:hypothetical protein
MNVQIRCLIDWPRRGAGHQQWLAPPLARIVNGGVFFISGRGKFK